MDEGLQERLKFPRLRSVGLYSSTLDPSELSPSLSFKRRVSNSHARAFEQCHHFPSSVLFLRYLRCALSFCRILCFNIAITVITPLPCASHAPPYTANEHSPGAKFFALLENHTPVRFPYTPHTVILDSRPLDNANLPSLVLLSERN